MYLADDLADVLYRVDAAAEKHDRCVDPTLVRDEGDELAHLDKYGDNPGTRGDSLAHCTVRVESVAKGAGEGERGGRARAPSAVVRGASGARERERGGGMCAAATQCLCGVPVVRDGRGAQHEQAVVLGERGVGQLALERLEDLAGRQAGR